MNTELRRNLEALARVAPSLVERISLPVESSHIELDASGQALYRIQNATYPLAVSESDLAQSAAQVGGEQQALLFGIGTGDQLRYVLEHVPSARITAWDRDPWLVRMALQRHDYSAFITNGRLRLAMGIDLVDQCAPDAHQPRGVVLYHPLLRQLYRNEALLLEQGVGERRALLCAGELFVEDLADTLRQTGYSVYTLDIKRLAREEQALAVQRFQPAFVVAVNYTLGLAEFCHEQKCPLLCWEVDPSTDVLPPSAGPTTGAHIFTYRKANVREFQEAGFEEVEYLPLAADAPRLSAVPLTAEDRQRYGVPISFVGSSLADRVQEFVNAFLTLYLTYAGNTPEALGEGRDVLQQVLAAQRADFTTYRIPELLDQRCPGFQQTVSAAASIDRTGERTAWTDPARLLGELAAAEKRLTYVARLGPLGIRIWGDAGWQPLTAQGAQYMGLAGHRTELPKIYAASQINLDVGRLYQQDIVTMRVFDILATGGFLLTERSDTLLELFQPDRDLVTYATPEELVEKSAYYLAHPDEARLIAERGQTTVLRHHTLALRLQHMLASLALERRTEGAA